MLKLRISAAAACPAAARLCLQVFLDASTIEVFANGRAAASRIYPMRSDSVGIQLLSAPGDARVVSLNAWEMRSIWDGTESIPDHPEPPGERRTGCGR